METTVQKERVIRTRNNNSLPKKEAELLAAAEALLAKGERMMKEEVNDTREQLGEITDFINLSYVANHYFGKSRTWLYQRINGNKVNGKTAFFTRVERKQLVDSLHDIGKQLLAIKLV